MSRKATSGSFRPGDPRAGRPAGTPNRTTTEVREAFRRLVEENTAKMQTWLERVAKDDPARALDLMARLAEFVIPKLRRTELHGAGDDGRITIEIIPQGTPDPSDSSHSEAPA